MEKVILTGPLPTPEETAQRLGLTLRDRVAVNKVLREFRKEEPRIQLLAARPKSAISHSKSGANVRSTRRRASN